MIETTDLLLYYWKQKQVITKRIYEALYFKFVIKLSPSLQITQLGLKLHCAHISVNNRWVQDVSLGVATIT